HGACLCAFVRSAGDGPAVFHRLRAMGPPGYGDVVVYRSDPAGSADQAVQQRSDAPGLHLCRRRGRGSGAARSPAARAQSRLVAARPAQIRVGSGVPPHPATSRAPWHVYNIGNSRPVEVTEVVRLIEEALGKPASRELLPMQPGDVAQTYADVANLERAVGFRPKTPIEEGIRRFVDWFLQVRPKVMA